MYARQIGEKTHTFQVSGKLWGSSLVMRDVETGSQWSHILGKAMAGPMKGTELVHIPSVMSTWKAWKTDHPSTSVSVLVRVADMFTPSYLNNYEDYVVGLRHRGEVVAYPLSELTRQKVIIDTVGDDPVVVCYDEQGRGVKIFRRTIGAESAGEALEFSLQDGQLTAGGSHWGLTTGIALDGPHADVQLEALPAVYSYRHAWFQFHPQCREYLRPAESAPAAIEPSPVASEN